MRDRILKTAAGSYRAVEWDGDNRSGIWPIGDTVLVLPDVPLEKTVGGIHLPDDPKERPGLTSAQVKLLEVSGSALCETAKEKPEAEVSGYPHRIGGWDDPTLQDATE